MIYVRDDPDIFRTSRTDYVLRTWSFFAMIFMISVVVLYLGSEFHLADWGRRKSCSNPFMCFSIRFRMELYDGPRRSLSMIGCGGFG